MPDAAIMRPPALFRRPGFLWLLAVLMLTALISFYGYPHRHKTLMVWMQQLEEYSNPLMAEPIPGDRHIIFLETSCLPSANYSQSDSKTGPALRLTAQAACALEAAATLHPRRSVFLAHMCPVDMERLRAGEGPAYARRVLALPNVRLWPLRFNEVLSMSPAAHLKTRISKEVYTDLVKYVLLWFYGGTIIHSDVFLLKRLDMQNFASSEAGGGVGGAALDWGWDSVGMAVGNETIAALLRPKTLPNKQRASEVFAAVLKKRCQSKAGQAHNLRGTRCAGFTLLPESYFNPVPAHLRQNYLDEGKTNSTLRSIKNCVGVNTWNSFSNESTVSLSSESALRELMHLVCPLVINAETETE